MFVCVAVKMWLCLFGIASFGCACLGLLEFVLMCVCLCVPVVACVGVLKFVIRIG